MVAVLATPASAACVAGLLTRSVHPVDGRVFVDGMDLRDLSLESLRATILVAEHDAVLFKGSLRRNLLVARPDADERALHRVLEAAAAQDIVQSLDGGLDGPVSERGRSLSGGQRQRVGLARALLADPPVLVLVDPTSALDSFTESDIVQRLRIARAGRTTIVLTTSPALLDVADHVVVVADGVVRARGTHRELFDADPAYRARFAYEPSATGTRP
jgi:putative ABC transport system ATP-binding protein